ncbi:MAG TPA: AsmA family protein, partial [Thermodesulfovibrionales bacterium]|nr:AsmA family protein [Thermodesulfovibrionales bacterium]
DIRVSLAAKTLNLDAIFSPGQTSGADKTSAPEQKKEEKEFEPIKRRMTASGSVAVDKILYKGVTVQNFRTMYDLKNNVFRIPSMTGSTLSGSFRLQSAVDLSKQGTSYSMNADINGIRLEDLTAAFAPKAKDALYGELYGKMDLSGAGTVGESVKQNLRGKGNFSVKNGKIKNARISSDLLGFLGLQDLREITMDKADGTFTVADRIVNLTSLITGRDLIIDEKGMIGMDERLDLGMLVKASEKLSPKMLSQSSIAQFLSEEKGWTTIPLRVGGTVTKPSYSIDMKYAGKKATERLQQKAGEEIFRSLSGDKQKKETAPPGEKKKGGKPEDLLKDLFK